MNSPEEVSKDIEYLRCNTCNGSRRLMPGVPCTPCDGWGFRVSPTDPTERMRIGLEAISGRAILELFKPYPPLPKSFHELWSNPPSRRLRLSRRRGKPGR